MSRLQTNIILPEGPLGASMCFLGQAPGREENSALKPFVGTAGQLLNRCFRQVGIVRSSVLINNIFRQQPPRNDVGYYFQDSGNTKLTWEGEEHVEQLRLWLENLLRIRNELGRGPNVLVAFGREAMLILTGKHRITKWRGSVLPCTLVPGFKVYISFHPSYVNRLINEPREALQGEKKKQQQNVFPLFLIDLERIQEQAEFPEIRRESRTFDISLTHGELVGRLKKLVSVSEGIVGVDIETLPGESGPILWMIGFSPSPDYAFVVPILKGMRFAWSTEEEVELWQLISKVFLNPNLKKVFQGGMYDLSILGRYYGLRLGKGTYEDTMLCHHASYPYIKKALETLVSIYTWEPYYKDEGKVHYGKRSSDEGEALYNCKDTSTTREIIPIVHRNARELGTWEGYRRTISVVPSLLGMMLRGVRIDLPRKEKLAKEFGGKVREHEEAFEEIVGMKTNLNSPAQLQKILYGYYGLPIQINHKTKKPTTDKDALKKLRRKAKGEVVKVLDHLLGYRKFVKLTSTYTSMEVDEDGRIHTSYSFVSTWRLNSSTSPFGGGGNLQNIPKKGEEGRAIRSLFIPDPRKVMLAADYSQAEARVVAWEAEDLQVIKEFLSGTIDVHWEKAKELFQIPSSVPYNPKALFQSPITNSEHSLYDYRELGKINRHAGNYGQGPVMLQTTLEREGFHFELSLCKRFILVFKQTNPFTMAWQRRIREQIKATRTLISSYGRKRQFMGRLNDDLFRAAYAFSPQNTVGEMMEVAIQRIWEELPYVDPLLNVHDEVICQLDPKDLGEAIVGIRGIMEEKLEIHGRELIIPVDFRVGRSWGELKEIEK